MNSAETIAAAPLLRGLEPAVLAALLPACHLKEVAAGALVLAHDDASADLYLVLSGGVRVTVLLPGGREIIFTDHASGEYFGELAAIDAGPRSASVTALFATQLAVLPRAPFRAALAASPLLAQRLLADMAARVRSLSRRFVEVALGSVRHRLVAELARGSRPRSSQPGQRIVSPPPRHHVLAARIGVRREAVTRELAALERAGLVRQETAGIVLLRDLTLEDLE
jgi:CRP-like cAMP-binding protein